MAKLVTVEQMQAIEKQADESGLSYAEMMENAGKSVAEAIANRVANLAGKRVAILTGGGNNGGDGLVAGDLLAESGAQVGAYLVLPRAEDDPHVARLRERGMLVAEADQDQRWRVLTNLLSSADIVVDAVFGTGLKLPLRGTPKEVLDKAQKVLQNRKPSPLVVAVDCPSGLDCDTGQVAPEAIWADLTVTLAAAKPGLVRFPGADRVGEIVVGDIGLTGRKTHMTDIDLELATPDSVAPLLPPRPKNSHKGTFGHVVILAGSITLPGAAALAALGAYKVGAGLVTLAVPSVIQEFIAPQVPEATWILLPHDLGLLNETAAEVLSEELGEPDGLLIGPGFGRDTPTQEFITRLLAGQGGGHRGKIGFISRKGEHARAGSGLPPSVVDADGLKLLADLGDWKDLLPAQTVLTPHPGEMAILTGEDKEALQEDRIATARQWAETWGHVVVLKGAFTVVAAPDGRATVLPFATSALASAGTGDVLAGAITGLRGQGLDGYQAGVLAGYLHGRAGTLASEALGSEASVMAGDVAEALPDALGELIEQAG